MDTKMKPDYKKEIYSLMEDFRVNPSNGNRYYQGVLRIIDSLLAKQGKQDTKMKTDWETSFDAQFGEMTGQVASENNEWVANLKPFIRVFIRKVLAKQEEQHKAEYQRGYNEALKAENLMPAFQEKINKLKQQHRKEIDKVFDFIWSGWNLDLSKKDRAKEHFITNLLEQKGK